MYSIRFSNKALKVEKVAAHYLNTILISEVHSVAHCGRGEVLKKIGQQDYWFPYMQAMVEEILNQCEICAENNIRKGVKTPVGHAPEPVKTSCNGLR